MSRTPTPHEQVEAEWDHADLSGSLLDEVTAAGAAYRLAQQQRDDALAALLEHCRVADAHGHVRSRIIEASGLSRQTVYDALGRS